MYGKGENILNHLKTENASAHNSSDDILISYDLQSGTYLKGLSDNIDFRDRYCAMLAEKIESLTSFDSILEIGIGEGITFGKLMQNFRKKPSRMFGFDISLSRVLFAQHYFKDIGLGDVTLFTSDLFNIPLPDNSIDVVFTSHAIEPNGGREREALEELCRIAKKYIVLLEPSYESAPEEGKQRMEKHGYIRNLPQTALDMGLNVIYNQLFEVNYNPLNPSFLTIIEKESAEENTPGFICPNTGKNLEKINEHLLYSREGFLAYPVINDIPCLLSENAILSFHLLNDFQDFKARNGISY